MSLRRRRPVPPGSRPRKAFLFPLLAVVLAAVLSVGDHAQNGSGPVTVAPAAVERPVPARPVSAQQRQRTVRALELLRRWDVRRAAAYAAGDPSLLRPLYVPGSEAGRRDRALLTRYAAQGLVVRGVVPQVRVADTVRGGRGRGLLELQVSERYPRVVVEARDGSSRVRGETRFRDRVVTLRRTAHGWRVASVAADLGGRASAQR